MNPTIRKHLKKYKEMSPVAKSSMALVLAKFFQKGLSLVTSPVFTRIMPQTEYGVVSTYLSWQTVIYIIATLNMAQGVFNNGMIDYKEDRDGFTCSILVLANGCTLLAAIVYLIGHRWLAPLIDLPDPLIMLLFLYCMLTPAYNYWMSRQRFEYKYRSILLVMMVSSVLSSVLSIACVLLAPDQNKATAKLLGSEGVMIGVGLIFFVMQWKNVVKNFKISYCQYALIYNLPLLPHYLSMYVLSSSDRIMISKMAGSAQTAIYNVAYTVASILLIFWNSVDAAYAPWIYQKMEEKNHRVIGRRGSQVLLVFFAATILATLFAPEIMLILAPRSYQEGIYVIPAVAAGVFFTAVYSLYMRVELYLKKMHIVTLGTVAAAVLNLVLNAVFIPYFGYIAAAYTTLICYILLALFHYVNIKRLGYGRVYDNGFVLAISLAACIVTVIVSILYKYTAVRYVCMLGLIIFLIWKRKWIIEIVRSKRG